MQLDQEDASPHLGMEHKKSSKQSVVSDSANLSLNLCEEDKKSPKQSKFSIVEEHDKFPSRSDHACVSPNHSEEYQKSEKLSDMEDSINLSEAYHKALKSTQKKHERSLEPVDISRDNDGNESNGNSSKHLVQNDPYTNAEEGAFVAIDELENNTPTFRNVLGSHSSDCVLPSLKAFTIQCATCLMPTQEKYEKLQETSLQDPFPYDSDHGWRKDVTCAGPINISQDGSRLWAIDKPNITQPPLGREQIVRIRGKGNTMLHILLFLLLLPIIATVSTPCDPSSLPSPHTLRSDKITILISGYSTQRIPILRRIVISYSSLPYVASVLILWHNPNITNALSYLSPLPPSVSIITHNETSLNLRFIPRHRITTRAIAISDDDLRVQPQSLALALRTWQQSPNRIVGFFARSHDLDLKIRRWVYVVHPDRYSIMLSKFMILDTQFLFDYSCLPEFIEAREVVDRERNCEDILMNFVVGMRSGKGPVLVDGRVRDWGDPRNRGNNGNSVVDSEGLSRRKRHRERRGECITEFHRLLGEMPLRYSYGKVVGSVGEQGLCDKDGKLVYCDRDE